MTPIIARLVLAMLLLPFAGIVLASAFAISVAVLGRPDHEGVLVAWIVTDGFVVFYWILIWRSAVEWSQRRVVRTLLAVALGAVAAACACAGLRLLASAPIEPSFIFGNVLFPIVFVLTTVLCWRETPAERFARVAARGVDTVACPICGYNMTGLRDAKCPECGAVFTLDQLLTAQVSERCEELPMV